MKLLLYIHSLENGGAERVVANLANHWITLGWDITVVTVAPRETDFYELAPDVKRICLDVPGGRGNIFAGAQRTARRVIALRRSLRLVRPDIALSAMHTANVVLAMAAHGLPHVLLVGSEHNFPPMSPMGTVIESLRSVAYGRLKAVVALTQECADWLSTHTSAKQVPVIPNPVSWPLADQEPHISPATCYHPGRRILLAAGRHSPEKDFPALVGSFSRLADKHRDWDLVILGDGPVRALLQDQVHACGLDERVFLPGRVGNMGNWYANADLFAMTSLFEGFPNTLVEAMACGLPVVSVDCDTGPRDIIRHGIDGLLTPPGDPGRLDAALDLLMSNDQLRRQFSERATEVRQRFSMQRVSDMWIDLFTDLASPNNQRPTGRYYSTYSVTSLRRRGRYQ